MITEDYVSFETAKLLKEKGFEWIVTRSFFEHDNCYAPCDPSEVPRKDAIAIPTLQMARKWLRKVHNLLVLPDYTYEMTDKSYEYKIYHLGENGKPEKFPVYGVHYDKDGNELREIVGYRDYELSYKDYATEEEACEEAIKYCLKNLI